jgi:hypothetical protein
MEGNKCVSQAQREGEITRMTGHASRGWSFTLIPPLSFLTGALRSIAKKRTDKVMEGKQKKMKIQKRKKKKKKKWKQVVKEELWMVVDCHLPGIRLENAR